MTSKEFKDWFEGFAEGCEAEKKGFTVEQVKRILDVAKGCEDINTDINKYPYVYTPVTNVPLYQPHTIDPPQPFSVPYIGDPINAPVITSTQNTTFIPENKSGSKIDAMKLISGLKMANKKED
jgi:hypothetical protein